MSLSVSSGASRPTYGQYSVGRLIYSLGGGVGETTRRNRGPMRRFEMHLSTVGPRAFEPKTPVKLK